MAVIASRHPIPADASPSSCSSRSSHRAGGGRDPGTPPDARGRRSGDHANPVDLRSTEHLGGGRCDGAPSTCHRTLGSPAAPWDPRCWGGGGPSITIERPCDPSRSSPSRRSSLRSPGALAPAAPPSGTPSAVTPPASTVADASAVPDDTAPAPTPVPGGQTVEPAPAESDQPTTTKTDWGTILDAVPEDFPVYPGAKVADSAGRARRARRTSSKAGIDAVARWYRKALEDTGSRRSTCPDPLEDGSRVLDSQGDLPECQVQIDLPAGAANRR